MLHHLVLVQDGAHARVGDLVADLLVDELGEGEGGVYPAVGVHHTSRDLLRVNGVMVMGLGNNMCGGER